MGTGNGSSEVVKHFGSLSILWSIWQGVERNWRLRQTVLTEPHRGLVLRAYLQTPPWSSQIWLRIRWAELLEGESQKPQLRKSRVSRVSQSLYTHTHTNTHTHTYTTGLWSQMALKAGWPHLKKSKRSEQTLDQGQYMEGKWVYEKMLSTIYH